MSAVRPTERCLSDLGQSFPTIDVALHNIDHPLIDKAQALPEEAAAGGAERVLSVDDRVWFKVKTSTHRGMATHLPEALLTDEMRAEDSSWWLGAAGQRKSDSASDFYRQIAEETHREGRGSGGVSSEHLLPTERDAKRLAAELAYRIDARIRQLVCTVIVASLQDGHVHGVDLHRDDLVAHQLSALVQTRDGEAYLSISARGFPDPRMLAIVLNAVPGVGKDDWMAEPGPVFGVTPQPGQIIYSTIIPPGAQAELLSIHERLYADPAAQ